AEPQGTGGGGPMRGLLRAIRRRRLPGLGLLLAALVGGAVWLPPREPSWPARLILLTGGLAWEQANKQPGNGRHVSSPEAFSPDSATLAVSEPGRATIWDPSSGRRLAAWDLPAGRTIYQAGFSPDGRTLAALSWDGKSRD